MGQQLTSPERQPQTQINSGVAGPAIVDLMRTKFAGTQPEPYFVAIGASGSEGLDDLSDLLAALPAGLPAVVLAVLHRPSDRISHLREVLARQSALPVMIPDEDQEFRVGCCYIGEPAAHLSLAARSRVRFIEGAHDKYRNRTVDLLFTSVAAHARARAIGVVLRGSLSDGSRGLAAIHFAGGITMVVGSYGTPTHGMPSNATDYDGPIDFTGSIADIAAEIVQRVAITPTQAA
jgi:two-component system chemotaxis response regulator CheB